MSDTDRPSISGLGLGAAAVGNLYRAISDEDAGQVLDAAKHCGVRYIDTAPHYGAGLSEQRIGAFLSSQSIPFALSTKVGRVLRPAASADESGEGFVDIPLFRSEFDYTTGGIRAAFAGSCERLGVDRVEALFLHDIGALVHGSKHPAVLELALAESLPTMEAMKAEGEARFIGLGVNEIEVCRDVLAAFPLDLILLAGRYTLFEHSDALCFMAEMAEAGVGIVIGGPFNSGLLVQSDMSALRYNYQAAPAWAIERVEALRAVCDAFSVSLPAAALAFAGAHPAVKAVIPGAQTAHQMREIVAWQGEAIPPQFWTELQEHGLIDRDAPTP